MHGLVGYKHWFCRISEIIFLLLSHLIGQTFTMFSHTLLFLNLGYFKLQLHFSPICCSPWVLGVNFILMRKIHWSWYVYHDTKCFCVFLTKILELQKLLFNLGHMILGWKPLYSMAESLLCLGWISLLWNTPEPVKFLIYIFYFFLMMERMKKYILACGF